MESPGSHGRPGVRINAAPEPGRRPGRHRCRVCSGRPPTGRVLDLVTAAASGSWTVSLFWPAATQHEQGDFFLTIRVLRVVRLLKFLRYMPESLVLYSAVRHEFSILRVFLVIVFTIIFFFGSLVWAVEDDDTFPSIPSAMWWAATTITTVGYGDVVPLTNAGRCIGFAMMLIGYSILAVPTLVNSNMIGDGLRSTSSSASLTESPRRAPALPAAEEGEAEGGEAEALTRSGRSGGEIGWTHRSEYPFFADLQTVHGGAGCISCPPLYQGLDRTLCVFLASAVPRTAEAAAAPAVRAGVRLPDAAARGGARAGGRRHPGRGPGRQLLHVRRGPLRGGRGRPLCRGHRQVLVGGPVFFRPSAAAPRGRARRLRAAAPWQPSSRPSSFSRSAS
ncbi:unnamed protein product, partial [Prorocentrum cordatum]